MEMYYFLKIFVVGTSATLFSLFSYYAYLMYNIDLCINWFYDNNLDMKEYDYIIVGAGSAGVILAMELTNANENVLLLEAGGTAPPFFDIPLTAPLIQKTPYDWGYVTVPQHTACKALRNNQSLWPMGKVLGGTSRLNYMVYMYGHLSDYNKWFPDFSISHHKRYGMFSKRIRSTNNLKWETGFGDIILQAAKELGQPVRDINKELNAGFTKVQLSMQNGGRWSTDKLLSQTYERVPTVVSHAHVNKVLMKSDKAVGVQFTRWNTKLKARARKGVVLSAGTIGSPKILMLSGIGPKKHLEELNIKVINDLPVGQHLVDHVLTGIDLIVLNTSHSLNLLNVFNPMSAINYFFFGKGPWTFPGVEAVGTLYSPLQSNKLAPDLQLMILPTGLSNDGGTILKKLMGISDDVYKEYFDPLTRKNTVTIAPVLLHPKSSGEVKLRSSDPTDSLLIDPKYLSNEDDVVTLTHGIQFIKKLIETKPMKAVGASIYTKPFPGCTDKVFDTMEYWKCYIQHLTLTSYHPAGTCRMGDVVDDSFRVRNVKNLYVVDASVLPLLPSGNINAAIMTLAERAARLLKQLSRLTTYPLPKCHKSNEVCYVFNACGNIRDVNLTFL